MFDKLEIPHNLIRMGKTRTNNLCYRKKIEGSIGIDKSLLLRKGLFLGESILVRLLFRSVSDQPVALLLNLVSGDTSEQNMHSGSKKVYFFV